MRVKTLTLATAALTFGLASPALASPTLGDHQGMRTQALVQRGGDDDGGGADGESFSGHRHCGSAGSCGRLFGGGPFGGFGGGFGGGGFGGGGGGDRVEEGESGGWCCAGKRARMRARVPARAAVPFRRPRLARPGRVIVHRRQVMRVPRRAVPTGFGGSQGMNLPLGIAGMTLILGGAGLLPLARRRIRTSERS